jgi:hypothetical protein
VLLNLFQFVEGKKVLTTFKEVGGNCFLWFAGDMCHAQETFCSLHIKAL